MKKLTVDLPGRAYDIVMSPGALDGAGRACRGVLPRAERLALVTDSNVEPLYAGRTVRALRDQGFAVRVFTIPAGESSKSMEKLAELLEGFMEFGLTRTDAVIALGGGVVGDLAGFAAASVLRGVDFVQLPTTLLAQVDSSVGGKVAVDLRAGKNLAGAFWQPRLVLMDPRCLDTLTDAVFADGMAEVIKYGCIRDPDFFDRLAGAPTRAGVMADIENVLYTCCDIKRRAVVEDERDTGARMLLNFGHTLGHAYELSGHYETWTHGQAVSAGMCRAAEMGVWLGVTPPDVPKRVSALVSAFGLPDAIPCSAEDYRRALGRDKKNQGGELGLVLLTAVGSAEVRRMDRDEVVALAEKFAV